MLIPQVLGQYCSADSVSSGAKCHVRLNGMMTENVLQTGLLTGQHGVRVCHVYILNIITLDYAIAHWHWLFIYLYINSTLDLYSVKSMLLPCHPQLYYNVKIFIFFLCMECKAKLCGYQFYWNRDSSSSTKLWTFDKTSGHIQFLFSQVNLSTYRILIKRIYSLDYPPSIMPIIL